MTNNDTSITVQREIPVAANALFKVLSNPQLHTQLDGSGFVRSLEQGDRLQRVGQKFTMNMTGDHMGGEYKTDNIVSAYDDNKMIGWKTGPAGTEPPGWEWLWELKPMGPDSTMTSLTYDWSNVDPDFLKKISFPLVSQHQLEESLGKLAEASTGA